MGGILANASIIFGALALLSFAAGIGFNSSVLIFVSPAAAIIGTILGVMSLATQQGKTGLILSLVSLSVCVLVFLWLMPGPLVVTPVAVQTPHAK
jgi:hypothetical protein